MQLHVAPTVNFCNTKVSYVSEECSKFAELESAGKFKIEISRFRVSEETKFESKLKASSAHILHSEAACFTEQTRSSNFYDRSVSLIIYDSLLFHNSLARLHERNDFTTDRDNRIREKLFCQFQNINDSRWSELFIASTTEELWMKTERQSDCEDSQQKSQINFIRRHSFVIVDDFDGKLSGKAERRWKREESARKTRRSSLRNWRKVRTKRSTSWKMFPSDICEALRTFISIF